MNESNNKSKSLKNAVPLDQMLFSKNTGIVATRQDKEEIELLMPLAPNVNHIGIMYAGALFTLGEMMGGIVTRVYFAESKLIPIVTGLNIKFLRMAKTDVTATCTMKESEVTRIVEECKENGKASYTLELELKDMDGVVVAKTEGFYQVRGSWERPLKKE